MKAKAGLTPGRKPRPGGRAEAARLALGLALEMGLDEDVDPRRILRAIAKDAKVDPGVRVRACAVLLTHEKTAGDPDGLSPLSREAIRLMNREKIQ